MKNYVIIVVAALSLTTLFSCQKVNENIVPETKLDIHTLSVAFPSLDDAKGTKVSLATTGKTQWEVGDKIVIFGQPSSSDASKRVVHEIVADDITNPEVAVFDVDFSGLTAETDLGNYHAYNVAFPYTDGQQYYYGTGTENYGRIRFQNTNQLLMSGYVSDDLSSIAFNHLTAAITFSVSGDYDSYVFSGKDGSEVVGYSNFIVEVKKSGEGEYRQKYKNGGTTGPLTSITGSVNGNGTAVNHIFLPVNAQRSGSSPDYSYDTESQRWANVVYLPNGFTIKLLQGGVIKKYITSSAPLTIRPGHMINLGELPASAMHDYVAPVKHDNTIGVNMSTATDLSSSATANCYIVDGSVAANAGASFKFKAAKGKGGSILTTIGGDEDKDVVVLWSTKNNATAPASNEIITAVDFDMQDEDNVYVVFKMPDPIVPGNAVIAAKNAIGEILWSWHIWVPGTSISTITDATVFGSKPIMDRNLGALVAAPADASATVESYGLLYQWGRKDPFPGMDAVAHDGAAKVDGIATSSVDGTLTIEESIKNPTMFAKSADEKDWVTVGEDQSNTLWNSTKTIYDPCPPGYIVPTRNSSVDYWSGTKLNELPADDHFADNGTTYGSYVIGTGTLIVFPFTGYIQMGYGDHYKSGKRSYIWSSYASSYGGNIDKAYIVYARSLKDSSTSNEYKRTEKGKCLGASVRCVAE